MFQANEERVTFKKYFPGFISTMEYGAEITDRNVYKWVISKEIRLTPDEIKDCIRCLEKTIGRLYQRRLKRLRNYGYILLQPKEQAGFALSEAKNKISKTLQQTSSRLGAVDTKLLSESDRKELMFRKMAIDSLRNIADTSMLKPVGNEEVELLNNASIHLNALVLFESGNTDD